ncbi:HAD family phosphatase [Flavitalea sp. BT771]|uniref:HAD family hydrolase n=1 Tax=Flavitalea sp. BT771 TaxID=3063329 RepID=UPI0026E3733D|nr:HAD family phosphatase [Flavitalea sp. BT771]MDO6435438.1 HAD family phosphatase [Flavitalea sp. BT771]MDV6224202.1 HAD family phosphatase [Flavitalea sp. BT771]
MQTLKAILFDLDGTLIDSEISHYNCWNALIGHYGQHLDHDTYMKQYAGVALATNAQKLIDVFRLDVSLEEMVAKREAMMLQTFRDEEIRLMPYALETLDFFAGLPMVLVTSSSKGEVRVILSRIGLEERFKHIVTRDDVRHVKPHPEPYQRAVELLYVDKSYCIAIEDTPSGMRSATAAGLTCFGVHLPGEHFSDLSALTQYISRHYQISR